MPVLVGERLAATPGALSAADLFGPLVAGGAAEARKLLTGADEVDELVEPDPAD